MMTSDPVATPSRAYVWVWLPGESAPVVAGVLNARGGRIVFNYGQSYLGRDNAIPLYLPELPLQPGRIEPLGNLSVAGCIQDAAPDAWGQRVILHRRFGQITPQIDPSDLSLLSYLLESGSDRIGALDFQTSPDTYRPRSVSGTLEELVTAAERLEAGEPFSPELDEALLRGSSIGGARPKALLDDGDKKLIAKFSSKSDTFPIVKAEAVAMELARRVGLNVPATSVTNALGHDVLLVERFDRTAVPGERRMIVSALTILGLDEMFARYATYHELADVIRRRFTDPADTLRELFGRIVFNICVSNTDDHARNHAAFWNGPESTLGSEMTLTPGYDICPQNRSGGETAQAMEISRSGFKMSQLAGCIDAADVYLLSENEARAIVDHQLYVIHTEWSAAADTAQLTRTERHLLWGRQILNPYALEGLSG